MINCIESSRQKNETCDLLMTHGFDDVIMHRKKSSLKIMASVFGVLKFELSTF
jgi:hypothetical protein